MDVAAGTTAGEGVPVPSITDVALALVPQAALLAMCALVAIGAWKYLARPWVQMRSFRRQGVPGEPFVPLLGQFLAIREYNTRVSDPFAYGRMLFRKHKSMVLTFSIGPAMRVAVGDPDLAQQITGKHVMSFVKNEFGRDVLSLQARGILLAEGGVWKRQRHALNPGFHHNRIQSMQPIFTRCAADAVRAWAATAGDGTATIDLRPALANLTLEVIGQAAFGSNIAGSDEEATKVYQSLAGLFDLAIGRFLSGEYFLPCSSRLPTNTNKTLWRDMKYLHEVLSRVIAQRRDELAAFAGAGKPVVEPRDLLDMILGATSAGNGEGIEDEEVLDTAVTFVIAGHETTSQALSWTMYYLNQNPLWFDRIREEVFRVCGADDTPTFEQARHELPMVAAVIYEAMRLMPPVPNITREAKEDVTLERADGSKLRLPKGTNVSISIAAIHHNPRLWPRPLEFRPERFAAGPYKAAKHPSAYMPFSLGKRNCIGRFFAITEAIVILASIVQRLHIKLSDEYRHFPQRSLTLKPKFGMPAHVRPLTAEDKAEVLLRIAAAKRRASEGGGATTDARVPASPEDAAAAAVKASEAEGKGSWGWEFGKDGGGFGHGVRGSAHGDDE